MILSVDMTRRQPTFFVVCQFNGMALLLFNYCLILDKGGVDPFAHVYRDSTTRELIFRWTKYMFKQNDGLDDVQCIRSLL